MVLGWRVLLCSQVLKAARVRCKWHRNVPTDENSRRRKKTETEAEAECVRQTRGLDADLRLVRCLTRLLLKMGMAEVGNWGARLEIPVECGRIMKMAKRT